MIPHDIFISIIEMLKMKLLVNKDDGNFHYTLFIIIFCLLLQNSNFMEDILDTLNNYFFKKNSIVLEGKYIIKLNTWRTRNIFLFSTNFKALWYFLEKNNYVSNNDIYKIKEYENTSDDVDDSENDCKQDFNSLFIVNQSNGFKITDDIYCNILFTSFDAQEDNDKNKNSNSQKIEVNLYSYKRSLQEIKIFLNKISKEYISSIEAKRKNKKFIYTLDTKIEEKFTWHECEFISTKNFNNMYFEGKLDLIEKINNFQKNKRWYEKEGLPYTLGIALHGDPGTGKTSIIKCISNMLKRHVVIIPLNKIKTEEDFFNCYFEQKYVSENYEKINFNEKIFVFEDIDCMSDIVFERKSNNVNSESNENKNTISNDQENIVNYLSTIVTNKDSKEGDFLKFKKDENNKITLSFILNLLDGIQETSGRVFIITSNHYDQLDSALKRPGRIDISLEMKKCSKKIINEMIKHFYKQEIDKNELENIKDYYFSPAEIINFRINSKNKKEFINKLIEKQRE
tara:strand:- start:5833 stop:7365 length:1533 start_codon:yes stop_codon:yes gene_type:complete